MGNKDQERLSEGFLNAIEIEKESEIKFTNSILSKKSATFVEKKGFAVTDLLIGKIKSGLCGKMNIELIKDPKIEKQNQIIKPGFLSVNDNVKLKVMKNKDDDIKTKKKNATSESSTEIDGIIVSIEQKKIIFSINKESFYAKALELYSQKNQNVKFWIITFFNQSTYNRLRNTIFDLSKLKKEKKNDVISFLLNEKQLELKYEKKNVKFKFFNENLNDSQKDAIDFSIYQSDFTMIHGPPGTGKTYTLVELIKQLVINHNERILICGPSNTSVDTILERLSSDFSKMDIFNVTSNKKKKKKKFKIDTIIRIGTAERMSPINLQHSVDFLLKNSIQTNTKIAKNFSAQKSIESEIMKYVKKLKGSRNKDKLYNYHHEVIQLKKKLKVHQQQNFLNLLKNSKVVFTTLHGSGDTELSNVYEQEFSSYKNHKNVLFDTIIIDEVSQSTEPQCWIPLLTHFNFKRLVIAGDNKQLPPVVRSELQVKKMIKKNKEPNKMNIYDLTKTLFDRILEKNENQKYKMFLNVQYRMNERIMNFPSKQFYNGSVIADPSVKNISLKDIKLTGNEISTCVWYDVKDCNFNESKKGNKKKNPLSNSKFNKGEAMIVIYHLSKLFSHGINGSKIGIISPYKAQVELLMKIINETKNKKKFDNLEISTVDKFQGREKEVIIISLVRSNLNEIGFLKDERRLNVAITRAKRHLCIIGNMDVMINSKEVFLKNFSNSFNLEHEVVYPDLERLLTVK